MATTILARAHRFGSIQKNIVRTASIRHVSSTLFTIIPTSQELSNGKLGDRHLEQAVRNLHEDGLVVVANVVPHEDLDHLNNKMIQDARILQARGNNGPYNYNPSNLQQDPPPIAQYFHPSIFLNSIASQITSGVLGSKPKWTFCSGNTAMPLIDGAQPQRQPVHSDADFTHPSHPFALVVNVPLIAMTPNNGSTEIWLGTHKDAGIHTQDGIHGERASGRIKQSLLDQQRAIREPVQPVIEKGSIVIRDLRLWHAGMPNLSQDVRVMLAMIHFAPWYRNMMRLEFGNGIKPIVERYPDLQIPVDWVSEEEANNAYLNRAYGNAYDFDQVE